MLKNHFFTVLIITRSPGGGGVLSNKEVGGLGPHIKFGGKIWGKVRPSSQNKRKFGKFCHQKTQKLGKSPNFGVISEIQRAKFGDLSFIFLEEKFGAPTRISEAKFGAKPPRSPNMEVPPPGLGPAKFHFYSKRKLAVSGGPSNQHRVFSKSCTWSFYIRGSSSKAKTFTLKISLFLPEHLKSLSRAVNFFQNSAKNCVNF